MGRHGLVVVRPFQTGCPGDFVHAFQICTCVELDELGADQTVIASKSCSRLARLIE